MRHFIDGNEHEIPINPDGTTPVAAIRKAANIPANKALVLMKPDGSNELLNPDQGIRINPGQYFAALLLHKRGVQ